MTIYTGLDVSDKTTHICAVDEQGRVTWRAVCATDPQALAQMLREHCPQAARVVLETGALSAFLYHGLIERGVPAVWFHTASRRIRGTARRTCRRAK